MIDLREHFGLWERCGNTLFFRKLGGPSYRHLLVNPVAGVMISAHEYPHVGSLGLEVIVRDGSDMNENEIREAYGDVRSQPWIKNVMAAFFTGLALTQTGFIRETDDRFFLKYYRDQTPEYKETGNGHSGSTGKDELLTASTAILGALGKKAIALRKVILRDEWNEFLEGYGIIEC